MCTREGQHARTEARVREAFFEPCRRLTSPSFSLLKFILKKWLTCWSWGGKLGRNLQSFYSPNVKWFYTWSHMKVDQDPPVQGATRWHRGCDVAATKNISSNVWEIKLWCDCIQNIPLSFDCISYFSRGRDLSVQWDFLNVSGPALYNLSSKVPWLPMVTIRLSQLAKSYILAFPCPPAKAEENCTPNTEGRSPFHR